MTLLVRKINRAKWVQNDISKGAEVSADAVTHCMKTSGNTLSTWKIDSIEEVEEAVLAIAAAQDHLDTFHVVCLDNKYLVDNGISTDSSPGITPVKELIDSHVDLCELTYRGLGVIADQTRQAFVNKSVLEYRFRQLKELLKKAIKDGRLNADDLKESVRNKLEIS